VVKPGKRKREAGFSASFEGALLNSMGRSSAPREALQFIRTSIDRERIGSETAIGLAHQGF
jgi:hypothetical protein